MVTPPDRESSFFYRAYNPYLQAGLVFVLVVLVVFISKVLNWLGLVSVEPLFPWMVAASFLLVYAIFNSIFSLSSTNLNKYWSKSISSFIGLIVGAGLLAWWVSAVPISEARSYKWIFLVLTLGYLIFLSMMGFMKNIVEFAQKEEWNQPRKKSRKRR